jgi:hypothetical protein
MAWPKRGSPEREPQDEAQRRIYVRTIARTPGRAPVARRERASCPALVVLRVRERGAALIVRGDAGIGKSALLAAARSTATNNGMLVADGRATLAAFLRAGGNGSAAARDLDIHATTLRYRLSRIEEVSGPVASRTRTSGLHASSCLGPARPSRLRPRGDAAGSTEVAGTPSIPGGSSCSSGFARQAQFSQANAARVTYMAISATPSKMVASPSPVICHSAIAVRMIAPTYTGASWNVR